MISIFPKVLIVSLLAVFCLPKAEALKAKELYDSVVKIETSTQSHDYRTPWNLGRFSGGTGTGFLIGENQFLTNAHVVSDARRVLISRRGSSQKHPARVVHVAHDCDLALLEVQNFAPFSALKQLPLGEMPELETTVSAVGYPTGGERLSVTRGVVSRIDFSEYSHSRADSHLVVQTDAAINPGNSGGPVFQDGKVIGVAFQGRTDADNVGYVIPMPVVRRFLKDIEDGNYDEYVDLTISTFPLFNPTMRAVHNLPDDGLGVLVAKVTPGGPMDGVLEQEDVLLAIDGQPIDSAGNIQIAGEAVDMNEVVERKFAGDEVTFELLRKGEKMTVTGVLKPTPASRMHAVRYEQKPRYVFFGGLVFQPLTYNLYAANQFSNHHLRRLYNDYVKEGVFQEREDLVVLTRVESAPLTTHSGAFRGQVLNEVNGETISSLKELHAYLSKEELPEFLEFRFEGNSLPLILPTAEAREATPKIQQQVGITRAAYLGE